MKILQLGKAYPPANLGGVEVVIQLLNEGLNDAGISCDALGVNDTNVYKEEKYRQGTIYRAKLLTKKFSTLFSIQLIFILKKNWKKYDIITIHSPDPMSCFALWLVNPKCKIVLYWHSDILRQKLLLKFYKPFMNWLLRRSDLIITTSQKYLDGSQYLSKYKGKSAVIPIGLNVEVLPNIDNIVNNFKEFDGKNIVFSLGRLAYYKGFQYLVLAAKNLPANSIVIIAGAGEQKEELNKIIEENNLQQKVFLIGKITEDEKDFLFRNAKIFALSSIYKTEAYAIVQVEALAYGLPIISTRIAGSGVDWVNQNEITGITVNVKSSLEISEAINFLLTNEDVRKLYSANASKRYKDLFTHHKMIDLITEQYEKVLK